MHAAICSRILSSSWKDLMMRIPCVVSRIVETTWIIEFTSLPATFFTRRLSCLMP